MKPRIVLTGGKFNKLHPGHLWLLKKAKKLGYLIVIIANDAHNKRPYAVSARTRKRNLGKLKIANKIVIGNKKGFSRVIDKFNPDTIVLGYDQKLPDKETAQIVKKMRIKVVKFGKFGNHKTRKM